MTHPKLRGGLDLLLFHNLSGADDARRQRLKLNVELDLETYKHMNFVRVKFNISFDDSQGKVKSHITFFLMDFNDIDVKIMRKTCLQTYESCQK